ARQVAGDGQAEQRHEAQPRPVPAPEQADRTGQLAADTSTEPSTSTCTCSSIQTTTGGMPAGIFANPSRISGSWNMAPNTAPCSAPAASARPDSTMKTQATTVTKVDRGTASAMPGRHHGHGE